MKDGRPRCSPHAASSASPGTDGAAINAHDNGLLLAVGKTPLNPAGSEDLPVLHDHDSSAGSATSPMSLQRIAVDQQEIGQRPFRFIDTKLA